MKPLLFALILQASVELPALDAQSSIPDVQTLSASADMDIYQSEATPT